MNKVPYSLVYCLFISFLFFLPKSLIAEKKEFNISLVYTVGGGGHKSAMEAFESALKNYSMKPENIKINFHKIDPPMSSCVGRLATYYWDSCFLESYYDLLEPGLVSKDIIEDKIFPTIGMIDEFLKLGYLRKVLHFDVLPLEKLIFKKGRPDLIISVINSGNAQILEIAEKHKIPFRIGLTDYKIDSFIDGIGYNGKKYTRKELEIYLPLDSEETLFKLRRRNIPFVVTRYPVHPVFNQVAIDLRQKKPEAIQKLKNLLTSYHIGSEDSVLLIMMGAKGFDMNATIKYIQAIRKHADQLRSEEGKLHLFLAAGQNQKLRDFGILLGAEFREGFQIHALENLDPEKVALFMSIDKAGIPFMFFTKPGGSTVGQAEALGTPTLYSLNPIEHERFNAAWMKAKNYAETIDMIYRSKALHPVKWVEVGVAHANQHFEKFFQLFPKGFSSCIQDCQRVAAEPFHALSHTIFSKLPETILNQDQVDEVKLIKLLREYLIEHKKFDSPPENQFAETMASIVYQDLIDG